MFDKIVLNPRPQAYPGNLSSRGTEILHQWLIIWHYLGGPGLGVFERAASAENPTDTKLFFDFAYLCIFA